MALTIKIDTMSEKRAFLRAQVAAMHASIEEHIVGELVAKRTAVNAEYEYPWRQRRSKLWVPRAPSYDDEESGGYA